MTRDARYRLAFGAAVLGLLGCSSDPPASGGTTGGGTSGGGTTSGGSGASAGSAGNGSGATSSSAGTAGSTNAGSTNGGAGGAGGGSGGTGGSAGASGGPTGPNVDVSSPELHEFELDPHATPLGKLVVFLPGANNVPRDWRDHGRQLASYGFHVMIPHYNNRWSSDGTCDGMGNTCGNDTRWEALVGEDTSAAIAIARGDSAEGRVVTMLKHLVTEHPGGDWGYYLGPSDAVLYDKMIIAGISHGAASTGMYAIGRPFTRAVMHSSGPQGDKNAAKMTPLSEWYAFTHTADPAYDAIAGAIENFALMGEPTSIDGASAPFGGSHRLITSAASDYPHGSTCAHSSSPIDGNDAYLFDAAWRYLYGAPPL